MKKTPTIFFVSVFEKTGSQYLVEDYELKDINLEILQKIFNVDPMDPDPFIRNIVYCQEIGKKEAEKLKKHINIEFDFDKYDYMLEGRDDYTL